MLLALPLNPNGSLWTCKLSDAMDWEATLGIWTPQLMEPIKNSHPN